MKQVAYVLHFRKIGKCLALILPQKFANFFHLKEDDIGIPCSIKFTKEELTKEEKDEVLGQAHFVIKIQRVKDNYMSWIPGEYND